MKKILSLVMVVAMLVAVLALVGCDNTKTPDETTTEATTTEATTTEETTTEETTTETTTTSETTTTTLYPVFARFDFGTDTKAKADGFTSHEYLTKVLTYDAEFISVEYTKDTIIVKALKDHPEMSFTGANGAESIATDENGKAAYSVTSYALCFEDLTTYDFDDEMKKEKGIMRIRIKNSTSNNIIAVRWHKAGQSYATTLLASCMYLQGGEPNMIDWINKDNKMTCEPSDTFETYDYNMNDLAALGRFGANKNLNSQSYGLYEYYVYCGGATGSNNWNWMGNEAITAFQFFVLGAYGGSAASGRYYFTYADTRANIVEGATVEIDYIIFGKDTTELDKFQSNIESESISISESISESISKSESEAAAATATTAAA